MSVFFFVSRGSRILREDETIGVDYLSGATLSSNVSQRTRSTQLVRPVVAATFMRLSIVFHIGHPSLYQRSASRNAGSLPWL